MLLVKYEYVIVGQFSFLVESNSYTGYMADGPLTLMYPVSIVCICVCVREDRYRADMVNKTLKERK